MEILRISEGGAERLPPDTREVAACASAFLWIDADQQWLQDPAGRAQLEALTGVELHPLHLQDTRNAQHPSYFGSTATYDMLIFQRLAQDTLVTDPELDPDASRMTLRTQPIAFFLLPQALVTIRQGESRSCVEARERLLAPGTALPSTGWRVPATSLELMLRLLNAMVDRYLALRQPLTQRLDRWQRELLDPRRRFRDWLGIMQVRTVLRRLDHLCEEQYDALQGLRMAVLERAGGERRKRLDALLIRINDVLEHVGRVRAHARNMESSLETAVQLHFAAVAHRTNEVMRILTIVMVLFVPPTLVTGLFGMNVEHMPLVSQPDAFWLILGAMLALACGFWGWLLHRRYVEARPWRLAERLARKHRVGRQPARSKRAAASAK